MQILSPHYFFQLKKQGVASKRSSAVTNFLIFVTDVLEMKYFQQRLKGFKVHK